MKDKIFIGDLSYKVAGTPFPLGAGYIATMVDNYFNNSFDTTIFIDPLEIIDALKKNPPKIIALANYSWNYNINSEIIKFSKKISKDIITVLGGPYFAKNDKKWLKDFFEYNKYLDFYVSGEGEWKFAQIVKSGIEYSYDIESIKNKLSPDIFFKNLKGEIIQGDVPLQIALGSNYVDTRKKHLDTIKSPYLSGRLDKFFEKGGMIPMIETVRGCPYSCTFCCWGDPSLSRLSAFSDERVFQELDYIAGKIGKSSTRLILADGNFGILKRDIGIAQYLNELNKKFNWPQNIFLYFAKNSNDSILKIATTLGKLIKVSLARQTMNEDVLKNVKRKNINDETFYKIQKELTAENIESMVEFIYPLPGETKKTFIDGIDALFTKMDLLKTEIRFYPTELMPGSEMATTESREKFGLKSAWRKLPRADKDFGDISSCEYQEIVTSTNTFSFTDFVYVRKLHFLICLFATYSIYKPIVELYQKKNKKNSFIWFIDKLIFAMADESNLMHEISKSMDVDIHSELIPAEKHRPDKNFQGGETRRINIFYILKLLYDSKGKYRTAFSDLIKKLFIKYSLATKEEIEEKLNEVEASLVDFVLMEKIYKSNSMSSELPKTYKNKSIVSEFKKTYNGNLIDTLDSMYYLSSAGHLERMLLKAHNAQANNSVFDVAERAS